MKAKRSNKKIIPLGGAIPTLRAIHDLTVPKLIQDCLGKRPKQAKYGYDDVIISWMLTNLCGGFRLNHITKIQKNFDVIPNLKIPSHDTIGRLMKSLASDILIEKGVHSGKNTYKESLQKKAKTHKIITTRETDDNDTMNKLLATVTCKIGLLNTQQKYDIDLDATMIETDIREAKKTYKKFRGFAPMVACIGNLPIFIEMRNGNVSPSARILESVQKCVSGLKSNQISVGRVRMDRGGYNGKTFDYLHEQDIDFVVGVRSSQKMLKMFAEHTTWKSELIKTTLYDWECESAEFDWGFTGANYKYRLVTLRMDRKREGMKNGKYGKTPKTWIYGGKYAYKMIITNDLISSVEELFNFYNQRGTCEKNFDALKNDFGWKLPPFSKMNENTVFLCIAALTNNIYHALLKNFSKKIKQVKTSFRLREFIFTFMSVSCGLIRNIWVFYNTDIAFEKIV